MEFVFIFTQIIITEIFIMLTAMIIAAVIQIWIIEPLLNKLTNNKTVI